MGWLLFANHSQAGGSTSWQNCSLTTYKTRERKDLKQTSQQPKCQNLWVSSCFHTENNQLIWEKAKYYKDTEAEELESVMEGERKEEASGASSLLESISDFRTKKPAEVEETATQNSMEPGYAGKKWLLRAGKTTHAYFLCCMTNRAHGGLLFRSVCLVEKEEGMCDHPSRFSHD